MNHHIEESADEIEAIITEESSRNSKTSISEADNYSPNSPKDELDQSSII